MTADLFLVWGRGVDRADDMDDALSTAWYRTEYSEDDWFDYIEVVSETGESTRMDSKHPTVKAFFDEKDREAMQRYREQQSARPFIGNITIDGKPFESLYGDTDPEPKLAELRPWLGDRVKFKSVPHPVIRRAS